MKRNLLFMVLLSAMTTLPACAALTYSAEAIEAKVVDAETKQPIEGVIVTANWELRGPATAGGSAPIGQLMVLETVTGKDGKFYFPAWGPKYAHGALLNRDPQLLLFKPGYRYRGLENEFRDGMELEPMRRSQWNGKRIEIKPFKGTMKEYAKHLGFFETSLDTLLDEDCAWKRIPRMILVVSKQSESFRTEGLYALPSVESLDVRYKNFESKCGSVKEFFRSYKP